MQRAESRVSLKAAMTGGRRAAARAGRKGYRKAVLRAETKVYWMAEPWEFLLVALMDGRKAVKWERQLEELLVGSKATSTGMLLAPWQDRSRVMTSGVDLVLNGECMWADVMESKSATMRA